MTVSELITFLQTQPQDLQVAYKCYSEQRLLDKASIGIELLGKPRLDGWIHDVRPDKLTQTYLVFPGN